jgi:hypothetical protein
MSSHHEGLKAYMKASPSQATVSSVASSLPIEELADEADIMNEFLDDGGDIALSDDVIDDDMMMNNSSSNGDASGGYRTAVLNMTASSSAEEERMMADLDEYDKFLVHEGKKSIPVVKQREESAAIPESAAALKSEYENDFGDEEEFEEEENEPVYSEDEEEDLIRIGNMVLTPAQAKLYGIATLGNKNSNKSSGGNNNSKQRSVFVTSTLDIGKLKKKQKAAEIQRLRRMNNNGGNDPRSAFLGRIEALAQPTADSSSKRAFARDSDRIHCKFIPEITRNQAMIDKIKAFEKAVADDPSLKSREREFKLRARFIKEADHDEKFRRKALTSAIASDTYKQQVDKMRCPNCGNPQSYDEFKEKRMKCPGDNCGGKKRRIWLIILDRKKRRAMLRRAFLPLSIFLSLVISVQLTLFSLSLIFLPRFSYRHVQALALV